MRDEQEMYLGKKKRCKLDFPQLNGKSKLLVREGNMSSFQSARQNFDALTYRTSSLMCFIKYIFRQVLYEFVFPTKATCFDTSGNNSCLQKKLIFHLEIYSSLRRLIRLDIYLATACIYII